MTTPTQPAEGLPEPGITQADRELLAAEYEASGFHEVAKDLRDGIDLGGMPGAAIRAIAAARRQGHGGTKAVEVVPVAQRFRYRGVAGWAYTDVVIADTVSSQEGFSNENLYSEETVAALLRERDDLQRWQDIAVQEMRGKDDRLAALANERDALRDRMLSEFEEIMATELERVSTHLYNSREICKHYSDNVMKRARALLTAAAEGGDGGR